MMWEKDGVIYSSGGIYLAGMWYSNPTPEQFRAAGWSEYTPPPVILPPPKYSKRKIILALGLDAWEDKRAELEAAGVYDLFTQSTYLCSDDPTFAAVYNSLTAEEKRILNEECLYDE